MKQLTMEELRKMDGKPVWVEFTDGSGGLWGLVHISIFEQICFTNGLHCTIGSPYYGKTYKVYIDEPPRIDRSAWEPCEYCGGEKVLYQHTNSTKLFVNTFGCATTLVTECVCCPPDAKCCMKDIPANSAFKINFCPNCGRPLSDSAWEMIDKRMYGKHYD